MSKVVNREDLSGERISVNYPGRDREMAYATIRNGEIIEGHIHYGPKYEDPPVEHLTALIKWAGAVKMSLLDSKGETDE